MEDFVFCKFQFCFIQRLISTIVPRFFSFPKTLVKFFLCEPNIFLRGRIVLFQPFLLKLILKHILRVLSTPTGPYKLKYFPYPNVFLRFVLSSSSPPLSNYCSSQLSMVHRLSSSIFPCSLFVVPLW